MKTRTALSALALAALGGCASCDSVPKDAVTDCAMQVVPGGAATDILFVIDDSGSMSENQQKLAANLGTFIDRLLGSAIALDVRVGVTNTSIDNDPASATTVYPSGGSPPFPGPARTPYPAGTLVAIEQFDPGPVGSAGHFLWGTAWDPAHATSVWGGPRILSSATQTKAQLALDFKANVMQGRWGSGKEQPLRAMKLALEKASCPGPNCGFLRDGARLAVVILTDEDDCSDSAATLVNYANCHDAAYDANLDDVGDYVRYLDTTVGGSPIVAVIGEFQSGVANPSPAICDPGTSPPPATPVRLNRMLNLLEPGSPKVRTVKASICDDFGASLVSIAEMIIPQTMPLKQAPADYRMMAVKVQKGSGEVVGCPMAPAGSSGASDAGVVYTPAPPGGVASLTFQNECKLGLGDKVDLGIVCVR